VKDVNLYYVQYLQNKKLNEKTLSKEEQDYLDRYEQANDDLFEDWLEAVY